MKRQHFAPVVMGLLALSAFAVAKASIDGPALITPKPQPPAFKAYELSGTGTGPAKLRRAVNPAYARIDGWISAVGAAVALGDIDGDRLPNDLCLVDPRWDTVTVQPAPQTGPRYRAFTLPTPVGGYRPGTIAPMGCVPGDFDEDGRTDLLVYYWGRTPVIFRAGGPLSLGASAFEPVEIMDVREQWFTNAALQADLDGDGRLDLVFGNYFPDGSEVLNPLAVNTPTMQHSMSRAFNGAGVRVFLGSATEPGALAFTERRDALPPTKGLSPSDPPTNHRGWTLALSASDLTGDLRPELYVANDFGPDLLLINETTQAGTPRFRLSRGQRDVLTARSRVVGRDSFKGMGADVGSVTGDGRPALLVSNISAPYALIESHFLFVADEKADWTGPTPMRDESGARGTWFSNWGWDIKFADLTNSGCPAIVQAIGFLKGRTDRWAELQELAIASDELLALPSSWPRFSTGDELSGRDHDRVFMPQCKPNQADVGRYLDISEDLDLGQSLSERGQGPGTVSRGIATGDVYGDGRLSVAIARQWMPSVFLRNVTETAGRAIVLDLRAAAGAADRPAIGATARVRLANGRVVAGVVDGGSGHGGKRAPEIHLGLGAWPAGQAIDVVIEWRDVTGRHARTYALTPGRHRLLLAPAATLAAQRNLPNG